MSENKSEIEKLLEEFPSDSKGIEDLIVTPQEEPPAKEEIATEEPAKDIEGRKNRKHRRWEQRLTEKERDLELKAARLEALTNLPKSESNDVPSEWIALYGDTPEAKRAWELNLSLINERASRAKDEALREIEERQTKAAQEQKQFEDFIDTELEELEDEFNVDLTSDSPAARKARREFLEVVSSLSPKDSEGNISAYADFSAAYEMYQARKEKPDASKAKDLSARTMVKSDGGAPKEKERTRGFEGWRKDYGL